MHRILLLIVGVLLGLIFFASAASAQSTYSYVGGDFTGASVGPNAPTQMSVQRVYGTGPGNNITGSFTTAAPLAAGLVDQNIGPQVASYAFNDPFQTYASTDPNVRKNTFRVMTDGAGQITSATIEIQKWQTNGPRSAAGTASADSRFDRISIFPTTSSVISNFACTQLSVGTNPAGDDDTCLMATDVERGSASSTNSGAWTSPAVTVPTLSEWAMILFGLLLAGGAALYLQRRQMA